MRPPDLEFAAHTEYRAPARGGDTKRGKAGRRESRLGLGRLFGRHRAGTETLAMRPAQRMQGLKEVEDVSVSETVGGIPYDLHVSGSQPDIIPPPPKEADTTSRPRTAGPKPSSVTPPLDSPTMGTMAFNNNGKRRGSLATTSTPWDPVPLFQAWPQAVRTANLPACLQADSLLRLHKQSEMLPTINHPDLGDERDMFVAMAKKKHRRNSSSFKFDWTTKIFILVTSGYLLQYAGDGPHDCLPEKVVRLTKHSAAFASDVIPGKHWVLQVSSVFENGTLISQDTRSLLGKFGLREREKRQASDILMIFENAADMDSWMTLLRREIEILGGRSPLTEIGTPRQDDRQTTPVGTPPAEASPMSPAGRPLVVKDPNFGRHGSLPEMRWDSAITIESSELHLDTAIAELLPEHSFDDNSTSNSFVSQDGRHLDGLRDSSNRYSFMSAARTIVTSESSACNSPIRDSFGSQRSQTSEDATPLADELDKIRLRPNATEIETRRQSYRTSNMLYDPNLAGPTHRQHLSLSIIQEPPNFSLPNRRRAASHTAVDPVHMAHNATASARPPRRPRRPPPPTLGYTRPLSIVADSPSPSRLPMDPIDNLDGLDLSEPLDSRSTFSTWAPEDTKPEHPLPSRALHERLTTSTATLQAPLRHGPRKYASTSSLRPANHSSWDGPPMQCNPPPVRDVSPPRHDLDPQRNSITPTQHSSMLSPPRSRSPIQRAMAAQRRASMYNLTTNATSPSRSVFALNAGHRATQSDPHSYESFRSPSPRRGSAPGGGHKRNRSNSSVQSVPLDKDRQSMPQMLPLPAVPAGPPPLPPPNKALPPIPVGGKNRRSVSLAPPRMRAAQSMVNLPGGEF
ncbi:unnamed protein product [Discula destructiva]